MSPTVTGARRDGVRRVAAGLFAEQRQELRIVTGGGEQVPQDGAQW
ncbi:hypothetical protein Misp01_38010 [Microtetraspora sp. NBRC 13810]|nr:hypothetical protein [Microtetraspora sp. NBRC 13810]GLW08671.1 hypothetical protein Misp01_38010 [Microtetraspora sp. NBRC 13810]